MAYGPNFMVHSHKQVPHESETGAIQSVQALWAFFSWILWAFRFFSDVRTPFLGENLIFAHALRSLHVSCQIVERSDVACKEHPMAVFPFATCPHPAALKVVAFRLGLVFCLEIILYYSKGKTFEPPGKLKVLMIEPLTEGPSD